MSSIRKNRPSRPLFPNNEDKRCNIIEKQKNIQSRSNPIGVANYDADVLKLAEEHHITLPLQTVKSKRNKYTKKRVYGVEVELATDVPPSEIYENAIIPWFYLKGDGTIPSHRQYAYELVSVPGELGPLQILGTHTLNYIKDRSEGDMSEIGGLQNSDRVTGMHVHCSVNNFIDKGHQFRFAYLFNHPAFGAFLSEISERVAYAAFKRWSPTVGINEYTCGWKPKTLLEFIKLRGKYNTTNFKKDTTIEIRAFQGDVTASGFCKNLQFVDSMIEFTSEKGAPLMTLPNYLDWLETTHKNRYIDLKNFISNEVDKVKCVKYWDLISSVMVGVSSKKHTNFEVSNSFTFDTEREVYQFETMITDTFAALGRNREGGPNKSKVKFSGSPCFENDGIWKYKVSFKRSSFETRSAKWHNATVSRYSNPNQTFSEEAA